MVFDLYSHIAHCKLFRKEGVTTATRQSKRRRRHSDYGDHKISLPDMVGWSLIFIPILLTANYLGRKVLLQLPDKVKDGVVILTMVYIVGDLSIKGIQRS